MCPECCGELQVYEYDFGRCPETGYHDAGARYRCMECGQKGDAADVEDYRRCAAPGEEQALTLVVCGIDECSESLRGPVRRPGVGAPEVRRSASTEYPGDGRSPECEAVDPRGGWGPATGKELSSPCF
jgi:hypothetical protein